MTAPGRPAASARISRYDELLSSLEAIGKPSGGQHKGRCPAHEDRTPSLSWTLGNDERILVNCHAGCTAEMIVEALGFTMADLFPPTSSTPTGPRLVIRPVPTWPKIPAKAGVWAIPARWDDGTVVPALHVRRDDGSGHHDDTWEPSGVVKLERLALYAPRDLAGSTSVVITEGERAAVAVAKVGITAVGTYGTSHTPSDAALEELRGFEEAILAYDNDPAGKAHLLAIARRLVPLVGKVRIAHPPADAAEGWDLADAVDRQQIVDLLTAAVPFVEIDIDASPPAAHSPTVWTVRELAELPAASEEAIIGDGIATKGGKILIYARTGTGKTTFTDFVAGPLASGEPFLGRFSVDRPRRVLVMQGELSTPELASHAQHLVTAGFDTDNLMFTRLSGLRLPDDIEKLKRLIEATRAEVIALDPWYRLFAGASSDKAEQVDEVFKAIDELLEQTVDLAVVVHHANVTGLRTSGSWVFEGWPSTILRLDVVQGAPTRRDLTFEKIRAPMSTLQGEKLAIVLTDAGYLEAEPLIATEPAGVILAVKVVQAAGGRLTRKLLMERLTEAAQCRERQAADYLGQAVQRHRLGHERVGREAIYFIPAITAEAE